MSTGKKKTALKRAKRDARTLAADIQIGNLLKHHARDFRVRGDRVSMPMALFRERLGFAYSHGELAMRARIEAALSTPEQPNV